MNGKELEAIKYYGDLGFKFINAMNRIGVKKFKERFYLSLEENESIQGIKNSIKHLDNAIKKEKFSDITKKYKSKVLWRGVKDKLPFKGIGSQIKTKSYLSASLESKISSNFAGKECCMYEIIPDENINVIDMEYYLSLNELEILIERNVILTLIEEYTAEFEQGAKGNKSKLKVYKITVSKEVPKTKKTAPKNLKVYKDTPINRKLNRVGKPYGYVSPAPQKKQKLVASPKNLKVYKDTPLNRKLNRVGKPYG